jgi:carbonic anhydrase/acetyltransferase-like protein (isoleucine patch superfamily)
MRITHGGASPDIHSDAYVSPAAVLSGHVRVGAHSRVLHTAVLTAEGGPLTVGERCVIMEGAVLRSTRRHPLALANDVLVGPNAYLTGCRIEDEVFIATGAMVFNGAVMRRASSVALGGAVHIGCQVPARERIPIGWVAVGDPARLYPPGAAEEIRAGLTELGGFLPYVFGVQDTGDRSQMMRESMRRYVRALAGHRDDTVDDV